MKVNHSFLVVFKHCCNKKGQKCEHESVTCTDYDLVKIYWDVNGLHQDDPELIDFIKHHVLVPPDSLPLDTLSLSKKRLMGQFEQVPMVEKLLGLKQKKRKGFFIEAGAACGEHLSNTLYLELVYGWTGLLVEPNPDMLSKLLSKHRNSWVLPHCLSTKPIVEVVTFDASNYNSGIMLDGKTKPSYLGGRDPQIVPSKAYERELKVQCFPLYSVLQALNSPTIDYFSLDIEGAEYVVLETLPWNKVNITLLSVETNHAGDIFPGTRQDIKTFLEDRGYNLTQTTVIDDFFLHKDFKMSKQKQHHNKNEL